MADTYPHITQTLAECVSGTHNDVHAPRPMHETESNTLKRVCIAIANRSCKQMCFVYVFWTRFRIDMCACLWACTLKKKTHTHIVCTLLDLCTTRNTRERSSSKNIKCSFKKMDNIIAAASVGDAIPMELSNQEPHCISFYLSASFRSTCVCLCE